MIYLDNNKIISLGGIKRAYLNNMLIFQSFAKVVVEEPKMYINFDLNNQWEETTLLSVDKHIVLKSFSNFNVGNSVSRMRMYIYGYDSITFKIYSDGESNYDYTLIGDLDVDFSNVSSSVSNTTTGIKYTTRGKQNQWLDAAYAITDPNVEHFIDVLYRKDSSVNNNTDSGYVALPMQVLDEKYEASTTEFITVESDGTYTFYEKIYKYITYDNVNWVITSEYIQGEELSATLIETGTMCDERNEYKKIEYVIDKYNIPTNIFTKGDLIKENSSNCKWVTLTSDTDRSIQMQTFRIDATDPGTSGNYFITFSATPNYSGANATITSFSICPDEGTIYDNGSRKSITAQTHIEGNVYEYTFSVPVYFAGGEANAPLSQVQYKLMVEDIPEEELPEYDVTATFNVQSTTAPTVLCNSSMTSAFTEMYVDGVQVDVTSGYTFSTTGEHTVNYMLADNTTLTGSSFVGLFQGCVRMTSIELPDTLTSINNKVFSGCTSLTEIVIPNSVTTIGEGAFSNCSSLRKITIGSGVTKLGTATISLLASSLFSGCTSLIEIVSLATTAPTLTTKTFNGIENNNGTLYVPQGSDYSAWTNVLTSWTIQYIT